MLSLMIEGSRTSARAAFAALKPTSTRTSLKMFVA
jgi:hypothetical protein